jgi:hypothetical protein
MGGPLKGSKMKVPSGKPRVSDAQESFGGGYNSAGLYAPVAPNEFAAMSNVRVLRDGSIAKRPGFTQLAAPTSATPWYVASWNRISAGGEVIMTAGVAGSGTVDKVIVTANSGAVTSISTTSMGHPGYAHFRDGSAECLYLAAGSGKLSKWDGTTFTDRNVGLSLNLKYVWVYNQRLFGVTASDQTLYWSGLNNGDTIGDTSSGGGSATIRTYGGLKIIGGFALGGSNVILHESAVSVFRGTTFDDINITAGVTGLSGALGCVSEHGYAVVGSTGYVMTTEGLATVTEAGVRLVKDSGIADPCAEELRVYPRHGTNVSMAYNVRAEELWIWMGGGGVTTGGTSNLFIYRPAFGKFTGHASPGSGSDRFKQLIAGYLNTGAPQIMWDTEGTLLGWDFIEGGTYDRYTDSSNGAYSSFFQCRRFFTNRKASEKSWRTLNVLAGPLGVSLSSSLQAVGTDTALRALYTPVGESQVTVTSPTILSERSNFLQLSGSGPAIDVKISDAGTTTTKGWRVLSVGVEGFDLGERGP